jgi:D-cysteine desulfhydrase
MKHRSSLRVAAAPVLSARACEAAAVRLQCDLPRLRFGAGPTPVRLLSGIGGRAPVWIKDDGAYSPFGGNKARKLEWLLARARERRCRTVISGGAIGTNHGLATALLARRVGLETVLVLVPQPRDAHVERQLERLRATGAELHFAPGIAGGVVSAAALLARQALRRGGRPYLIPPGGSMPLGCVGYVVAGLELGEQVAAGDLPEPTHVIVALGSGGTAAGLLLGLRLAGLRSRLAAVLVNDLTPIGPRSVARLANRTGRLLRRHGAAVPARALGKGDLDVDRRWLGDGYGHPTEAGRRAAPLLGGAGIEMEQVYTAKAAAALLAENERGAFGPGPLLYWHTYRRFPEPGQIEAAVATAAGP